MTTVAQTLTTWQDGDATRTVAVEGDIVAIRQTYNDAVDGAIVAAIPLRAAIALARQIIAREADLTAIADDYDAWQRPSDAELDAWVDQWLAECEDERIEQDSLRYGW